MVCAAAKGGGEGVDNSSSGSGWRGRGREGVEGESCEEESLEGKRESKRC
jgi:hypothetical protein